MNDQVISPISQKQDKDSTLITSIQQYTGFKRYSKKKKQSKLRAQTKKKEIQRKRFLCADDRILYVEKSMESTKCSWKVISSARRQDTRSTCKIQLCLHTSNEQQKTEIKISLFTTTSKE